MKYKINYEEKMWGHIEVEAENEMEAYRKAKEEIEIGDNVDLVGTEIILLECNGKEII